MKTSLQIICFALLAASLTVPARAEDVPAVAWEEAFYLEQGAGDFAAAAERYERLANDERADPALRESARLRLAYCRLGEGRDAEGRALLEALLDSPDARVVDAAAAKLLALAGDDTRAVAELLRRKAPSALARWEKARDAARVTLRGSIDTWDGRRPTPVHLRVEGRASEDQRPVERPVWYADVDAGGRFTCPLPPGEYELVISTPVYERHRQRLILLPEMKDGLDLAVRLERIQLPDDVHQVYLLGDWLQDWTENLPMTRGSDGVWEVTQRLPAGVHHYKFMVGHYRRWLCDVRGAEFQDDARGGFNTVLRLDAEQDVVFRFDENDPRYAGRPSQ